MAHIALLGDSIFDNGSYVEVGSSVVDHLRQTLPSSWKVSLLALDGATTTVVHKQIERLPADVTHVVLSAGGNDALWMSGNLFPESTTSVRDSLEKLGKACQEFRVNYRLLINKLKSLQLPVVVCTVYDSVPDLELPELTGLCAFNDSISRIAFENRIPLIDLRVVCNETSDYSEVSSIEPSSSGGLKIARAISSAVRKHQPLITS